jgi:hypothetical protein
VTTIRSSQQTKTWVILEKDKVLQTILRAAPALTLGVVLLAGRFIEPVAIPGVCIFRLITGYPCMFCGLTHALHALLLGHWIEAVSYHPLVYLAFALIVLHFIFACLRAAGWKHPRLFPVFDSTRMMTVTFVVFSLSWMMRFFIAGL